MTEGNDDVHKNSGLSLTKKKIIIIGPHTKIIFCSVKLDSNTLLS